MRKSIWMDEDEFGRYSDVLIGGIIQRIRWIPSGAFLIGSPPNELERYLDEGPQHQVSISQDFWLANTPCTQELWQAVMGNNPSRFNRDYGGGPDHPVERVSWFMAQDFLQKLNSMMPGYQFTLPTEAEWEYACRAETVTPFSFGDTISTDQANYNGNSPYNYSKKESCRRCTVPVKALPANACGLYQMHGNVWEWCADIMQAYDEQKKVDPGLEDAIHPPTDKKSLYQSRVIRGGSWSSNGQALRCAFRNQDSPDEHADNTGFRFVIRNNNHVLL